MRVQHKFVGVVQTEMVSSLKEVVGDLKAKFTPEKYADDPGLLKQRVKEQGKDIYYWLHTFENLFITSTSGTRDDLLFYVKYDSKNKREIVEAQRKDGKSLPNHSDQSVLWDQTLYLNLLLHEFEYHLTCCVLSQKKGSESVSDRMRTQVTMQVYPSTNKRRMDKKTKTSENSYPNLMFYIDNFEQIFNQVTLFSPGEKVAVQITAINPALSIRRLIFMGALDFSVLKNAVRQKEKENASFTASLLSRKKSYVQFTDDFYFIQMNGPDEKGHAEMAVFLTDELTEPTALQEPMNKDHQSSRDTCQPITTSSSQLDSSMSSLDTVDNKPNDQTVGTPPPPLTLPLNSVTPASPGADSVGSTHSTDPLCPTSTKDDRQHCSPIKSNHTEQQDGGNKKNSKRRLLLKKKSEEQDDCTIVHAYLTCIQLPWYTMAEDILQGFRKPLF